MTRRHQALTPPLRLAHQAQNPMFRLGAMVHGRSDILHLEFGEPDFPTPSHIVAAAMRSLGEERQGYSPSNGMPWLRAAIAARVARVCGITPTPDQIIVTPGGTGALMASLLCLTQPGDEVLLPDPAWAGYDGMVAVAGVGVRRYPLSPSDGWQPDPASIEASVTPKTKVLLLNSPSNPAGAVYPEATIASIMEIAGRHGLWVLSDECYDELIFAGRHVSPLSMDEDERVISVGTFSKTYAMTGWRIGWLVAPPALIPGLNIAVAAQVNNLPTFVQRGAEAALIGSQEDAREMLQAYRDRRDLAIEIVRARGRFSYLPEGAFYLLIALAADHDGSAAGSPDQVFDSIRFAEELIAERGIAVGPGAAFGSQAAAYARVSLASSPDTLRRGISGLLDFADEYQTRLTAPASDTTRE
jgi:aspartate/methionine/tyrosine aminotransferase